MLCLLFAVAVPSPPALQLSPAESAVLTPLVAQWNGEKKVPSKPLVVVSEGMGYARGLNPSLRLELLRHGVSDAQSEELLGLLALRNRSRGAIESPALAGTVRISYIDLFKMGMGRETLPNLDSFRMLAVPAVARNAAIVFWGQGPGMGTNGLDDMAFAYLTNDGSRWRVAWVKHFRSKELRAVRDPDAVPHRANVSADDAAIIDAVIEHFHARSLVDATLQGGMPSPHDDLDALRAEKDRRSPAPLFLGGIRLQHPVALVHDFYAPGGVLAVSLPGYSADGRTALIEYSKSIGVVSFGEAVIEKRGGQWTWVREAGLSAQPKWPASGIIPYRAGGGVLAARPIKRVEPQLPPGTPKTPIIVEMIVTIDGIPSDIRVLAGGNAAANAAVLAALQQWRFTPGTFQGKPVPVIYDATIGVP